MSLFDQNINGYDIESAEVIRFITTHYKNVWGNEISSSEAFKNTDIYGFIFNEL